MGTHPIFESDFDCLTERKKRRNWKNERVAWMKTHTELIECWSDRCYSRLDSLSNQRNRTFTQNEVDFIKTAFQLFLNKFHEHFSVDECESLISSLEGSSQSRDTCFVV